MATQVPNSAAAHWERVYKRTMSPFVPCFVAFVLSFLGLAFLIFMPIVGVLILALAIGVPILIRFLFKSYTIVCGPGGFSVSSQSQRSGSQQGSYRWVEVTATKYEEYTPRREAGETGANRTTRYFSAETAGGQAFRVDDSTRPFEDLIGVFNYMTPHLPYTWERQTGAHVQVGLVSAGRSQYRQAFRAQGPAAAPAPGAGGPGLPGPGA